MNNPTLLQTVVPWVLTCTLPVVTGFLAYRFGIKTDTVKRQNAYRQKLNEERLKAYQALIDLIADRYAMKASELVEQHLQLLMRYIRIYPCISEEDHQAVMEYISAEHRVVNRLHAVNQLDTAIATDLLVAGALEKFLLYMRRRLLATEEAGEATVKDTPSGVQEFNYYHDGVLDDPNDPAPY